jgi:hypothetical protein
MNEDEMGNLNALVYRKNGEVAGKNVKEPTKITKPTRNALTNSLDGLYFTSRNGTHYVLLTGATGTLPTVAPIFLPPTI